jgi:hypothetical protein
MTIMIDSEAKYALEDPVELVSKDGRRILVPDARAFVAANPTTNGFWHCDVLCNGRIYCSVLNVGTEEEAKWRAEAIAKALNAAPPESFK